MSEPKYGRLPIDETLRLIEWLETQRESATEDVYTMLWWLDANGWDIVKSKAPNE